MRAVLPDTAAARDTLTLVRSGVLRGLSVEFQALEERAEGDLRIIELLLHSHWAWAWLTRARIWTPVLYRPAWKCSQTGKRRIEGAFFYEKLRSWLMMVPRMCKTDSTTIPINQLRESGKVRPGAFAKSIPRRRRRASTGIGQFPMTIKSPQKKAGVLGAHRQPGLPWHSPQTCRTLPSC